MAQFYFEIKIQINLLLLEKMRICSKSGAKSIKNKSFDNNSIISLDYLFFKNGIFKRKRNKNSYIEAFLEKRRLAAEFAQKRLSYSTISIKPKIINNEKTNVLSLNEVQDLANINNLKKNLPGKSLSILDNKNSNNLKIERNSMNIFNKNRKNNKLIQKFTDNLNKNLNSINENILTNINPSFESENDEKEETSKFGNRIIDTNKSRKIGFISTKNTENEKETFYIENNIDINNSELSKRDGVFENNKEKDITYIKKIKKINTYIKKRPINNENNSITTLRKKDEFINNQVNNSISFRNDLNNKNKNVDSKEFCIKCNDKNKNDINRYIETNNEENDNNNLNLINNLESIETSNDAMEEINVIKTTESNEKDIFFENYKHNNIETNKSNFNFEKEKNIKKDNKKLKNDNYSKNNIEIQSKKNKNRNFNENNEINSPFNKIENKFSLNTKKKINNSFYSKNTNVVEDKNYVPKTQNQNFKKLNNLKLSKTNEDNANCLNQINDLIKKIREKRKNKENNLINLNEPNNKKLFDLGNEKINLRNNNKEIKSKTIFNTNEDKIINNFMNNSNNNCNILNYKNNLRNKIKNKNNNIINISTRVQNLLNNINISKKKINLEDNDKSHCIFTQNVINYINNNSNLNTQEETKKIINNNYNYKINNINYNNQSNNFILLQNYYNNDTKNYKTSNKNFASFEDMENNVTDINFISEENSENEIINNKDMKLFDDKLFKNLQIKHKRLSKSKPTINLVKINKILFNNGNSEYNKNNTNSNWFTKYNNCGSFVERHLYIDKVKEDILNRNKKLKIEKYCSKSKINLFNSNNYMMKNITNKNSKRNSIDMNIMPANNLKGLFKI